MCSQGISSYEACSKYPDVYNKLQQLEQQLSGRTTATLILIYNNKIYVANVGTWDRVLQELEKCRCQFVYGMFHISLKQKKPCSS